MANLQQRLPEKLVTQLTAQYPEICTDGGTCLRVEFGGVRPIGRKVLDGEITADEAIVKSIADAEIIARYCQSGHQAIGCSGMMACGFLPPRNQFIVGHAG